MSILEKFHRTVRRDMAAFHRDMLAYSVDTGDYWYNGIRLDVIADIIGDDGITYREKLGGPGIRYSMYNRSIICEVVS